MSEFLWDNRDVKVQVKEQLWIMKYSRTVHSCPDMASSVLHRMNHFPLQPKKLLDFLCHESTLLPSTRNFRSFSAKLLSSQPAPAYNWHEVIPTQVQNLAFCLHWTSQGFPSSLFSNLVICFWMAAQSSGVAATPLSFVSDANLLSAAQCPITRSGTKMFNNTEHNSNPSRILLVPELQLDVMLLTTTLRPSRSDSFQPMSPLFYFIHTLKDWVWVDYGILSKVSHKVKINDTCCSSFIPHGHHISP